MVSVTAYPKGPLGWLSVSPTTPPATSLFNSPQGQTRSTTAIVPIAANAFSIQASDATDVTVDILMYFQGAFPNFRLNPLTPCRAFDTRSGDGPMLTANQARTISLIGRCGITSPVVGYVVNATLVPVSPVTTFDLESIFTPAGGPVFFPTPSNDFPALAGQATAKMMLIQSTASQQVHMRANADTHVIIDVIGVITP
ncbi:MAG: hypothetical protein JNL62_25175 [Bryobacterales bacterium]|nr:hypothetical protein [Bryobacterales bacterium]